MTSSFVEKYAIRKSNNGDNAKYNAKLTEEFLQAEQEVNSIATLIAQNENYHNESALNEPSSDIIQSLDPNDLKFEQRLKQYSLENLSSMIDQARSPEELENILHEFQQVYAELQEKSSLLKNDRQKKQFIATLNALDLMQQSLKVAQKNPDVKPSLQQMQQGLKKINEQVISKFEPAKKSPAVAESKLDHKPEVTRVKEPVKAVTNVLETVKKGKEYSESKDRHNKSDKPKLPPNLKNSLTTAKETIRPQPIPTILNKVTNLVKNVTSQFSLNLPQFTNFKKEINLVSVKNTISRETPIKLKEAGKISDTKKGNEQIKEVKKDITKQAEKIETKNPIKEPKQDIVKLSERIATSYENPGPKVADINTASVPGCICVETTEAAKSFVQNAKQVSSSTGRGL